MACSHFFSNSWNWTFFFYHKQYNFAVNIPGSISIYRPTSINFQVLIYFSEDNLSEITTLKWKIGINSTHREHDSHISMSFVFIYTAYTGIIMDVTVMHSLKVPAPKGS